VVGSVLVQALERLHLAYPEVELPAIVVK
jgi:hypothetical protein